MSMDSLAELYQETIFDHSQSPRKAESLAEVTYEKTSKNPLCGDVVTLEVNIKNDHILDVACKTKGCAISTAAGSIMATEIVGKTIEEALNICDGFISALNDKSELNHQSEELCILSKVNQYPTRVKCATLPWSTLKKIIEEKLQG